MTTSQATNEVIAILTLANSSRSAQAIFFDQASGFGALEFSKELCLWPFSWWYEPYDFAGSLAGSIQADSAESGT